MSQLRAMALAACLGVTACSSLPTDIHAEPSYVVSDTANTRLGVFSQPLLQQAQPGQSGFRPLIDGVEALLARLALAEMADKTLDVQYYIWHDDLTGRFFANALLRAADRGVRVRVLLDDVGVNADDATLTAIDAHPNIEIRLFNPIASRTFRGLSMLGDIERVNRRMHNKALIADNQSAIVGGRNIGDEYFDASGEVAFGDLDVVSFGPIVGHISQSFDSFWNSPAAVPVSALHAFDSQNALATLRGELAEFIRQQQNSPYVSQGQSYFSDKLASGVGHLFWGEALALYDDPDKITRSPDSQQGHLLPQFAAAGGPVQRELFIVSPYFIPGDEGVAWLRGVAERGVAVTILTNSLAASDVGAVHAGYRRYRQALLQAGIRLYELKPGAVEQVNKDKKHRIGASRASLHAKTFIFDRSAVFIGSLNLDPRSIKLNTEVGIVCKNAEMAQQLNQRLDQQLGNIAWRLQLSPADQGQLTWHETSADGEKVYHDEPQTSLWRRMSVWFIGLLPVESQL